jgi:hypothetical protein
LTIPWGTTTLDVVKLRGKTMPRCTCLFRFERSRFGHGAPSTTCHCAVLVHAFTRWSTVHPDYSRVLPLARPLLDLSSSVRIMCISRSLMFDCLNWWLFHSATDLPSCHQRCPVLTCLCYFGRLLGRSLFSSISVSVPLSLLIRT